MVDTSCYFGPRILNSQIKRPILTRNLAFYQIFEMRIGEFADKKTVHYKVHLYHRANNLKVIMKRRNSLQSVGWFWGRNESEWFSPKMWWVTSNLPNILPRFRLFILSSSSRTVVLNFCGAWATRIQFLATKMYVPKVGREPLVKNHWYRCAFQILVYGPPIVRFFH